jgi:hypothetical protein
VVLQTFFALRSLLSRRDRMRVTTGLRSATQGEHAKRKFEPWWGAVKQMGSAMDCTPKVRQIVN